MAARYGAYVPISVILGRGVVVVLPGHEWPFGRLSRRIEGLREHHRERLAEIERAVVRGCATTWEVAEAVSWARPFSAFTPRSLRSALAETSAHLVRLVEEGRVQRTADHPGRWTPERALTTP